MKYIERLRHGGIMTNYQCPAACRHCLYACSPKRDSDYITKQSANNICKLLILGGCRSVHIGGGEPFLNFDRLIVLLEAAKKAGIRVEYVETNGFFAEDEDRVKRYLRALFEAGVNTLCISLDPFHAEYVPFALPLRLAELCRHNNFNYFLWQERFLQYMNRLAPDTAHSRESLEKWISPQYIINTARSYGLSIGGRAVNIEEEFAEPKPVNSMMVTKPCERLKSTDHFHVDLYGRYIPPGCTGIVIPLEEVVNDIPTGKYPVFEALISNGAAGLVTFAQKHGFKPKENYTSSCVLCFYTRKWLSENISCCPELDTKHYEASLTYY